MDTLLIDIGSTFTKVAVVDDETGELLGTSVSPTTVGSDVREGLQAALRRLGRLVETSAAIPALASSSAAGGLRLVAVGLVPELTAEAARRAALSAGAKVVDSFGYELSDADLSAIERLTPDMILLAGGTDGGNREVILHNAGRLAALPEEVAVVVAGNKAVAGEAARRLGARPVRVADNVMPAINRLRVEPAQAAIRDLFLERIIHAKGIDRVQQRAEVVMPTPMAVLRGAELLGTGLPGEPGLGDIVVVDVGGATTDVYSIGTGRPDEPGVIVQGLEEPFAKRTVEGDLGVRHNARNLLDLARERNALPVGVPEREVAAIVDRFAASPECLAEGDREAPVDAMLAYVAVDVAVERHVGRLEVVQAPDGKFRVISGKDLRRVSAVIGTGGPLVRSAHGLDLLRAAQWRATQPFLLRPEAPRFLLDRRYVLYAAGLLAQRSPRAALRLALSTVSPEPRGRAT